MKKGIPVIDLFAGPGGLGEGFASYTHRGLRPFRIALSVEKDHHAYQTLLLRRFFHSFPPGKAPESYYRLLSTPALTFTDRWSALSDEHPAEAHLAEASTVQEELGKNSSTRSRLHALVAEAIATADPWILIGGPPCQAYSIAGRSRNRGNPRYDPESDGRQYLYREYLRIIADHAPPIFVMENVKGLLSATLRNERLFQRITKDLSSPRQALRRPQSDRPLHYSLVALTENPLLESFALSDFVVRMEQHGVPQTRHRIIIIGVRDDLRLGRPKPLAALQAVATAGVLEGLPPLRGGLSEESDSDAAWIRTIRSLADRRNRVSIRTQAGGDVLDCIDATLHRLHPPTSGRGAEFLQADPTVCYEPAWFLDPRLGGVFNHSSRSHLASDLHRYLFASAFAHVRQKSPTLRDFPDFLMPDHRSAASRTAFADRFRVQLRGRPSGTVVSHIAKDGHYYIHYDPAQCRTLSVREAARLQTFPDNYFFSGPRTAQYVQVGNAVPPFLARSLAGAVHELLGQYND